MNPTRRKFLKNTLAVAAGSFLASCKPLPPLAPSAGKPTGLPATERIISTSPSRGALPEVFVGAYNQPGEPGIFRFLWNAEEAALAPSGDVSGIRNPSFLVFSPNKRFVYAVNETANGEVSAYQIETSSGELRFLNKQPTGGDFPCHLTTDLQGSFLFAANYGGSLAIFQLEEEGSISGRIQLIEHTGHSLNPARQEGPHPHCVVIDPGNRFLLCCDLGLDKVILYRMDNATGKLTHNGVFSLPPGAGPRHLAFHPSGKFVYCVNELNSTISAFGYDAEAGSLSDIETVSTLPEQFAGSNTAAEVSVHPSGNFVYASNRGHDSIAIFGVDIPTGQITLLGNESTGGKTPRHFEMDPTGKWLFVGNQDSGSIAVFRIDVGTGGLAMRSNSTFVPNPVCVRLLMR